MYPAQPFVRFLIPLVAGILSAVFLLDRPGVPSGSLSFFLGGTLAVCLMLLLLANRYPSSSAPTVFVALFCLGMLTTVLKNEAFQKQLSYVENQTYDSYILEIKSLGEKRKTTDRYDALLTALRVEGTWRSTEARVVISLADRKASLSPGSRIMVKGHPVRRPASPLNPAEFDYQKYLERKAVPFTVYLPEGSFVLALGAPPTGIGTLPQRFSARADSMLRVTLKNPSTYGLVKAMVLARRDDLGADLLNAYIQAGAVHVLAVSGLHVGILFVLLAWILGGLRKRRGGRFVYLGVIIAFLTFYALITGLSPSVVRASLMCVTFAVSQTFRRTHDGVNTLAISALIILLLDPLAIFSVGFQLSYAAVLGILLFYPLVKQTVDSKYRIVQWLGQITLVSLAAQVFTLPLSIYYFHQFPFYFLLVNPFVIGLTPVLIYSALAILSLSWLGWVPLNQLLAYWTNGIGEAMNYVVQWPRSLPYFLLENLDFDFFEVGILLVTMLALYHLLKSRHYPYLRVVGGLCLGFFTYATARSLNQFTAPKMLVHAVPKHTVLSVTQGQKAYIIADAEFKTDTLAYNFHLKSYFITQGTPTVEFHPLPDKLLSKPARMRYGQHSVYFDARVPPNVPGWVIVRQKQYPRMGTLPIYPNARFVLSQELGFKTKAQWGKLLQQAGNQVTNPAESGAFEVR